MRKILITLVIAGLIPLIVYCIYLYRPLIATSAWTAEVQYSTAESLSIPVYSMLFRSHVIFIKLPENRHSRYQWFAVNWESSSVSTTNPKTFPYLHFNHDMALGITLDFPKIEDAWELHWAENNVTFSNPDMTITVSRK